MLLISKTDLNDSTLHPQNYASFYNIYFRKWVQNKKLASSHTLTSFFIWVLRVFVIRVNKIWPEKRKRERRERRKGEKEEREKKEEKLRNYVSYEELYQNVKDSYLWLRIL